MKFVKTEYLSLTFVVTAALLIQGCVTIPYQGQARDVKKRHGDGGILAMKVDFRPEDRAVADQKMQANCSGKTVKVDSEEEVVVGQKTEGNSRDTDRKSDKRQVGTLFGIPMVSGEEAGKDTASSSTTTALKEWQIVYVCVGAK